VVDHHVDRPEVEALQGVELTGTNRSEILINYAPLSWHWKFFSVQISIFPTRSARATARHRGGNLKTEKFLAPMAAGSHPFPSRTRQLSPPAPMIVWPQGLSKVGRCQIKLRRSPLHIAAGSSVFAANRVSVVRLGGRAPQGEHFSRSMSRYDRNRCSTGRCVR
jgi:hypothetical protein